MPRGSELCVSLHPNDIRLPGLAEWFDTTFHVAASGRYVLIQVKVFYPRVPARLDIVPGAHFRLLHNEGMIAASHFVKLKELSWPDDPDEAVMATLSDPRWEFRTVEGIVRATGLDVQTVRDVIRRNSEHVRGPLVPDERGREIYTLASRKPSWKERYLYLRSAFLGRVP